MKKYLRIGLQTVGTYYVVSIILTNIRACFYQNQIGTYFGVAAPSVEVYLATVE